jgi:hypothetical protein
MHAGWRLWPLVWLAVALALALLDPPAARAQIPEFTRLEVQRTDAGVLLDFDLRFELPRGVEEALQKGVPLYFVAEARVYRPRWYWRDKRVAKASRAWRVAFQPLTRKYRVTSDGINQSHDHLSDALAMVRRVDDWKIADASEVDEDSRHYVELSYRLDTTLLPRPMQIGIGGQPEWTLLVEKHRRFD